MFDISKLKLVNQIYSACASFFGLGADATEAEIHQAIEGKEALSAQLEAARTEAIAAQAAQLESIQDQLTTMQEQLTAMQSDIETKDARIADLQVEAASHTTALEALRTQHGKEVSALAGQVSSLKAGKAVTEDVETEGHSAAKIGAQNGQIVLSDSALKSIISKNGK